MRLDRIKQVNYLAPEEVEGMRATVAEDKDYDVLLTGPTHVTAPGLTRDPLVIYLPGALKEEITAAYPLLAKIKMPTRNRGDAAGAERIRRTTTRTEARPVLSAMLGAADPQGGFFPYCRLTAYTADQVEDWQALRPLFQAIGGHLKEHVPERHLAQMREVARTKPDWVIPGTPFTTITVNNTYATGYHYDKGDLDAGFSTLCVARRGEFEGGRLVFPRHRLAVDLQDGDLVLMNAHEMHGNTSIVCACGNVLNMGPCPECKAERISVVSYFRTRLTKCGTAEEEDERRRARALASQEDAA